MQIQLKLETILPTRWIASPRLVFQWVVAQFLPMGNDGYTITNHPMKRELWLRDSHTSNAKWIVAARFIYILWKENRGCAIHRAV